MTDTIEPAAAARRWLWWPSLLGAAFATFVAYDLAQGRDLAPVVAASGFVYLGAAAFQKPSWAWPLFIVTFIVIAVARAGFAPYDPTWALIILAAILALYGFLRGAARQKEGLPLQALAMIVFGAIAAIALVVNPTLGAYLVAAGLFAHAGWDAYHHRTGKVVVRSMAEFCLVLDVALAIVIIVTTLF
jgi:hypothetical protein